MFSLAVAAAALVATAPAPLAVSPGRHAVGFKLVERAVPVGLWYPSAGGGAPLQYRHYVALDGALDGYRAFLRGNGVAAEGIEAWLAAPLLARRDARPAPGRFPVVLLAAGMGGAFADQAALAEHLASHGYVVASTPSPVRRGVRMEGDEDVLPMAVAQREDLEIALAAARGQPGADPRRLGLVGYSFGARPQLLLAARHPQARALVSLDGGIGAQAARGWVDGSGLDRAAVTLPILHVWQDGDPTVTPDFALIESLERAPRTLARVEGLRHLDLPTWGPARASLAALAEPDRDALAARVEACYALARAFLDVHVKGHAGTGPAAVARASRGVVTLRDLPARPR